MENTSEIPVEPATPPPAPAASQDAAADTPDEKTEETPAAPAPPFRIVFAAPTESFTKLVPNFLLRGCQSEAILCWKQSDKKRKVISLPTGGGKTRTALTIAAETTVGRTLWIAHRKELIDQPVKDASSAFPGLVTSVVKGGQNGVYGRLVIASIQTLAKRARLTGLARGSPFNLVVVDECHHSTASTYVNVLQALGCFDKDGPELLGLTATPVRSDKNSLAAVYEDIVYSLSVAEAIEAGYLVEPRALKVFLPIDAKAVKTKTGPDGESEFEQGDLERELVRTNAARATAHAIKEHAKGRKTICFTVSVDQAKRTAGELVALGLRATWASGAPHMTNKQREDVIAKLAKHEVDVVCNAQLLCLDEQTEVLTKAGWRTIDTIQPTDEVAGWLPEDNMRVVFSTPRMIVKRDREPGERMVSFDTPRMSIRVTEDHDVVFAQGPSPLVGRPGGYVKVKARDAQATVRNSGNSVTIPTYDQVTAESSLLPYAALTYNPSQTVAHPGFVTEEGWHQERVWCVTTDSGFVVTRRRGTVSILGNCEGFDDPGVSCVVMAKPTRSKSVYVQAIGRGLRLAPGKSDCLVIDIVGASELGIMTIDAYLADAKKNTIKRKPRPKPAEERDPDAEWRKVQSYLKSARIDHVHHGDVAFARVSDGLLVTVTKDGEYLLVRRSDDEADHWVVERRGVRHTLVPTSVHAAMEVAAGIARECGGVTAPGSKTWDDAVAKPVPPPAGNS